MIAKMAGGEGMGESHHLFIGDETLVQNICTSLYQNINLSHFMHVVCVIYHSLINHGGGGDFDLCQNSFKICTQYTDIYTI